MRPATADALALLPPGAGLVAGVDLERVRQNFFLWSLAQFFLPVELPRDEVYDRFVAETGFAPERDLDRVTLALVPASPRPTLVAVLSGRFPRAALVRYALTHGASYTPRSGVDVYRVPLAPARELWFAPLSDKMLLVANGPALEAALARAENRLPMTPNLLFLTATVLAAAENTVWMVADPKLWPDPSPVPRELARAIELAWFEGKLTRLRVELKLTATCRSEREGSIAESNLRGLQLAAVAALARGRPRDVQLEKLAREIQIRRSGSRVEVSAGVGLELLRQWLTAGEKKEPARSR